jgi:hypothetical protein
MSNNNHQAVFSGGGSVAFFVAAKNFAPIHHDLAPK